MNGHVVAPKAVAVVSSTIAFGVAATQEIAETVNVPSWALDWAQLAVVGLVGLAWWSIRKTYVDHDRRLQELEKKEGRDVDRLTTAVHSLEITAAEIRATCPFCRGSLVVSPGNPGPRLEPEDRRRTQEGPD